MYTLQLNIPFEGFPKGIVVDDYSPYCSKCGACGHEGCCSPLMCIHDKDGDYCPHYIKDLQFGYRMNQSLMKLLDDRGIVFEDEEYKKIFDEKYEKTYGI